MNNNLNSNSLINLSIVADDFGMHKAINDGILETYLDGLLTDTNLMPPTPAFLEAVQMAKKYSIPCGLHATFTCEWDYLRWGPISSAKSLVGEDSYFKKTVSEAWESATIEDAVQELYLQYEMLGSLGITPTHVGEHMNFDNPGKFSKVIAGFIAKTNIPYKNQIFRNELPIKYKWDSVFSTSGPELNFDTAKKRLLALIDGLIPGYHMWVSHPAIDSLALDKIAHESNRSYKWAKQYRVIDRQLLLDKDVASLIYEKKINLINITSCPIG